MRERLMTFIIKGFWLLSSSLLLFPQCLGWYVLWPSSGVCRTREPILKKVILILKRLKFTSQLMAPRGWRFRGLAWRLSQPGFDPGYGKLICLATLMSSVGTKQICLWMTIYIYIYIYIYMRTRHIKKV